MFRGGPEIKAKKFFSGGEQRRWTIGRAATGARPKAVQGRVREGVSPSRKGVRGYYPRENFDILYDRMCILECRIATLYVYDLWPWMEERGIN